MEGLYKNFIDEHQSDLSEAMFDEIKRLLIEFSNIKSDEDVELKSYEYANIIMELIYETRYEW